MLCKSLSLCLALALLSCVRNNSFTPLGSEASLQVSWTLDGAEANSERCSAAGIADIQLVFIEDVPVKPREFLFNPQLCADGGLDTRELSNATILSARDKLVFWRTLDSRGFTLASGATQRYVVADGHFDFGVLALPVTP